MLALKPPAFAEGGLPRLAGLQVPLSALWLHLLLRTQSQPVITVSANGRFKACNFISSAEPYVIDVQNARSFS